jgi:hypothetical protein
MKHIYRFGDKGYVQMDSYPENLKTHVGTFITNTVMSLIVLTIAAVTAGAIVGIDITNPQLWNNGNAHSTGR